MKDRRSKIGLAGIVILGIDLENLGTIDAFHQHYRKTHGISNDKIPEFLKLYFSFAPIGIDHTPKIKVTPVILFTKEKIAYFICGRIFPD